MVNKLLTAGCGRSVIGDAGHLRSNDGLRFGPRRGSCALWRVAHCWRLRPASCFPGRSWRSRARGNIP
ncbi:hypothetical protein RHECNPAF_430013 [Rhizobium etli CNPAF512]|nr:hypothetical protein RHECNPAF_430013 [Rhizobium etli CNPAF512]